MAGAAADADLPRDFGIDAIPYEELAQIKDRTKLIEFLRGKTYALDNEVIPVKRRRRKLG